MSKSSVKDKNDARKAREKAKARTLVTLLGELDTIAKRSGAEVTDDLVVQVVTKFIKSLKETMAALPEDDSRYVDAVDEAKVLEIYLPKQLTEDELRNIIAELNYTNIGQYMKALKEKYSGQYDAKLASRIIKENI